MQEPISGGSSGYLSAKQKIEKCAVSSSLFELMELIPSIFYDVEAVELATSDARPGYTRHVRGFTNEKMEISRIVSVPSGEESGSLHHSLMTNIIIKRGYLADNLTIFSKEELNVRGGASESEIGSIMGGVSDLFSLVLSERIGALTLLPNTAMFEAAAQAAEDASGSKEFSIILADIDALKQLNTNHGYAAGDSVLAGVADRFRNEMASLGYKGSVVFRPGKSKFLHELRNEKEAGANPALKHDEFAVLIDGPVENAVKVAKWMKHSVEKEPFSFELPLEGSASVTCSFGIAGSKDVDGGWRKMLDMCIFHLGHAKEQGGNAVVS